MSIIIDRWVIWEHGGISLFAALFSERNTTREEDGCVARRETTWSKLETRFAVPMSLPLLEFLRMRFQSSLDAGVDAPRSLIHMFSNTAASRRVALSSVHLLVQQFNPFSGKNMDHSLF